MKRNKKVYTACISPFLIMLLCSCSGYTEIENMDILTSHFVSKNEDRITIGGGVANVRNLSDSMADSPVRYIFASGSSLSNAIQNFSLSADHKPFYGGIRVIILGEEYAKSGTSEFLDYILSTPDHRTSASVVTSSSNPREIVEYKAINDFTGGFAAESIIRTMQTQNLMAGCSLSDVCEARAENQVGFIIPDITIENNVMSINGYSIFDYDKKIAQIGNEYTAPVNYFLSRRANGNYRLYSSSGTYFSANAKMLSKNISVYENDDGRLNVNADFNFDITLSPSSGMRLTDEEKLFAQRELTEIIKNELKAVLEISKAHECDFLKLYKSYQAQKRSRFYKTDWREKISGMSINVSVSCPKIKDDSVR